MKPVILKCLGSLLCVAVVAWLAPGCDSDSGNADTGQTAANGGVDGGTGTGGTGTGTGGTDGSGTGGTGTGTGGTGTNGVGAGGTDGGCVATATGTLWTDQGELTYADAAVAAAAKHAAAGGCTNELAIALDQGGGCALSLTLQTSGGAWTLAGGSLTVDAACGTGIAESAFGTYSLNATLSTGAMTGTPTVADASATGCTSANTMQLKGLALFDGSGGNTIEVNLNGLSLTGDVLSTPVSGAGCPAEVASCPEQTCGEDAYGAACGTCGDGLACMEGACIVWNCPPEAPFGTHPGKSLTNVELRDCDGNSVWLHELCGADAAFFNLLAGW